MVNTTYPWSQTQIHGISGFVIDPNSRNIIIDVSKVGAGFVFSNTEKVKIWNFIFISFTQLLATKE